jgi:late competence protein required for DNA uptake (superfamily II DNA/RNA helicase)
MGPLAQKRCFHHSVREAVARCPECGRFFCRECITEHQGRVLCAGCLAAKAAPPPKKIRWSGVLTAPLQLAAGLWLAWWFFVLVGKLLLAIPTTFHDGSVW